MSKLKVAVLGLGAMGSRMAARLLDAKIHVIVFNRSTEKSASWKERGATVAKTPKEAADEADVILSCVRDDEAAKSVWLDDKTGAVLGLAPGKVAIESSTTSPSWIARLESHVVGRGAALLDAPVVGSRPQAETGNLVMLVGGSAPVFDRVRPVFEPLSTGVHHLGPCGSGMRAKLIVNSLFAIQIAAWAELRALGARSGLNPSEFWEVVSGLPVTSPALKNAGRAIEVGDFMPQFPIDLVAKDLRYALGTADDRASTPLLEQAEAVFERAHRAGLQADNITGVARLYVC